MSITDATINEFINNNTLNIKDLSAGVKYHPQEELEEFDEETDISLNFTFEFKDVNYLFDAYFHINEDNSFNFFYNTKIGDKYHSRIFEDLESIDDLKDIFDEQIEELLWTNTEGGEDEDGEEEGEEDEEDDE